MVQELRPLEPEDPEEEPLDPEESYTIELAVHPDADALAFFELIIDNIRGVATEMKKDLTEDEKDIIDHFVYAIKTARLVNSKGDDWHTTKKDYEELLT